MTSQEQDSFYNVNHALTLSMPQHQIGRIMKSRVIISHIVRITFMICLIISLSLGCAGAREESVQGFSFGAIADCQYCAVKGSGQRKYSISNNKLSDCVLNFNSMDLEFVVHLGDFIDRDVESFDVVGPIFKKLRMPGHHVLGNHDFSVADKYKLKVPEILGMHERYYHFKHANWRFIVLDGNDISFHAYPSGSESFKAAEKYYSIHNIQSPKWNGAIGPDQIAWLGSTLIQAQSHGENVILFCHFPVYPENVHNLWNADEILALIDQFPCVKAYINGHNHNGNYGFRKNTHYLTLKGMVDTEISSYAVISPKLESIHVKGYGRENDRILTVIP